MQVGAIQTTASCPMQSSISCSEGGQPGGFMELIQQMLSLNGDGAMELDLALTQQLEQQLTDESSEMGAQILAELMSTNPMLLTQLIPVEEQLNTSNGLQGDNLIGPTQISADIFETVENANQDQSYIGQTVEVLTTTVKKSEEAIGVTEQGRFYEMVKDAQKLVSTDTESKEGQKSLDIDQLQKQVDSSKYLAMPAAHSIAQASSVEAQDNTLENVSGDAILRQATEGITQHLKLGEEEFVIKLRPEGLGEITVKMVEIDQKITLSIITTSEQTGRMLNSELGALREALRPYNAQVEQVVSQVADSSSYFSSGSDLGSFARQQMFRQQQNHQSHPRDGMKYDLDELDIAEGTSINSIRDGLDVHI